jgi:hypothetical protein
MEMKLRKIRLMRKVSIENPPADPLLRKSSGEHEGFQIVFDVRVARACWKEALRDITESVSV